MSLDQALRIVKDAGFGMIATCAGGMPRLRPMVFVLGPGGVLWSSTYRTSGKLRELGENPQVEIAFVDGARNQVRIQGVVDTSGGPDKKRALLEANPGVRKHFADEHDPRFVHLEVTPRRIAWKPPGFSEYQVVLP